MSKIALYSAIAGTGSVGVVVVAVATGALDLSKPDPVAEPAPAALIAPEVATVSPQAAPQPNTGDAASLVADPAPAPVPSVEPEPSAQPEQAAVVQEQVAALAQPELEPDAPSAPDPTPETIAVEPPEPTQEAQPAPEPVPPKVAEEAAPAPAPQTAEVEEPVSKTPAPTFDIVRTETDGSTLIAGAAVPGSQVEVMLDGKAEVSATVGSDGRFVAFVDVPTGGAASVLTLRNETAKGLSLSEQEVIITPAIPSAPEKQPQKEAVVALVDPENSPAPVAESGDAIATETPISETPEVEVPELEAPQTAAPEPEVADPVDSVPDEAAPQIEALDPPAPIAPKPAETAVAVASEPDAAPQGAVREEPEAAQEPAKLVPPTILLSSARGVEVLQTAPLSPGDVALDSISYDEQGDVLLAGRGEEASSVRIYLDNTPVTTSRIREDGRWRVELPEVDTGTYTLRVDQIDESGAVIARVESLFLRESAEVLTRAAAASGGGIARSITVQPGHTLWEISNDRYGDGKEYVRVFEANRDRIGDPDLIYPGQIFDLPK